MIMGAANNRGIANKRYLKALKKDGLFVFIAEMVDSRPHITLFL